MATKRGFILDRESTGGRYASAVDAVGLIAEENGRSMVAEANRLLLEHAEVRAALQRLRRRRRNGRGSNGR